MSAFWLKIVASDHIFYNGHCSYLAVPAPDGEMGIMPHHEAMILAIKEGNLRFKVPEDTEWHQAIVGRGILQVANNRVTMIVDTAERPEDIDEVRAREALERAQEQLRQQLRGHGFQKVLPCRGAQIATHTRSTSEKPNQNPTRHPPRPT